MALEDTAAQSVSVETAAPTETAPPSEPSAPQSSGDAWRDDMRSILSKSEAPAETREQRARDERGRFARAGGDEPDAANDDDADVDLSDDDASAEDDDDFDLGDEADGEIDEADEASAAVEKPRAVGNRISDEDWSAAPEAVQSYIAHVEQAVQQERTEMGRYRQFSDPILKEFDSARDILEQNSRAMGRQLHPAEAVAMWTTAERSLNADPNTALINIAQAYVDAGADFGYLANAFASLADGSPGYSDDGLPPDPQVTRLEQRQREIEAQLRQEREQRAAQEQAAREAQFQQLQQRNEQAVGNVLDQYPILEQYADDIQDQIFSVRQRNPNLGPGAVLKLASERALRMNGKPVPWQQPKRQPASDDAIKRVKASKTANIKGQSKGSKAPKDWRDEMRAIAAKS